MGAEAVVTRKEYSLSGAIVDTLRRRVAESREDTDNIEIKIFPEIITEDVDGEDEQLSLGIGSARVRLLNEPTYVSQLQRTCAVGVEVAQVQSQHQFYVQDNDVFRISFPGIGRNTIYAIKRLSEEQKLVLLEFLLHLDRQMEVDSYKELFQLDDQDHEQIQEQLDDLRVKKTEQAYQAPKNLSSIAEQILYGRKKRHNKRQVSLKVSSKVSVTYSEFQGGELPQEFPADHAYGIEVIDRCRDYRVRFLSVSNPDSGEEVIIKVAVDRQNQIISRPEVLGSRGSVDVVLFAAMPLIKQQQLDRLMRIRPY